MDEIDREIINILISNGRISARNISKRLQEIGVRMSERGIGKRIARIEKERIIRGYTAMVDPQMVNMKIARLIIVKFTSPKDFLKRVEEMKKYLEDAPYCDFSARTNGDVDWIELKFFNNAEQAKKEEDLYRSWFGDIIEDYKSYDLGIDKWGWQIYDETVFERFIEQSAKKNGSANLLGTEKTRRINLVENQISR